MARLIRNGRAYPRTMKTAVLATWAGTKRSAEVISTEYNMAGSTVSRWVGEANLQRGTQHPNTKAGIERYLKAKAAVKAFNTPTVLMENGQQVIKYQGKTYR